MSESPGETRPGSPPPSIDAVAERLVKEMRPRRVILFGSAARDDVTGDADLDLMVVLDEVADHHAEMVRAYEAIRDLRLPADILVFSQEEVDEWGDVVGHVINDALHEGRILYDAA